MIMITFIFVQLIRFASVFFDVQLCQIVKITSLIITRIKKSRPNFCVSKYDKAYVLGFLITLFDRFDKSLTFS